LAFAAQKLASAPSDAAVLWVREAAATAETGDPYGPGLAALGLSPTRLVIGRVRTQIEALRATLEGARCAALSAVILETIGAVDLTASRKLKLAAEKSGVTIVLIRLTNPTAPNAVQVRWSVRAVPSLTKRDGRKCAAFEVAVLKHPAGLAGRSCIVEWDNDRRCFTQTLSFPVAAIPISGSLAA
jgi:protein ImuA